MRKFGEQAWKQLSEQERQRRIIQIKRKERTLRLQGKHDQVEQLFAHLAISDEGLLPHESEGLLDDEPY